MRNEVERLHKISGPEITGYDAQKVKDAVAELSFRAGQKGKTVMQFAVLVPVYLSTKELGLVTEKAKYHHSLRVVDAEKNPRGTTITVERIKR